LWWGFLRLEFELRTSQLLGRCSTTWATTPVLIFKNLIVFDCT
jgi:hypothetical protein